MIRPEWQQSVAEGSPCGPNLEYDQEFLALEDAARGRPEQQFGATLIPAVPPDWADVVRRAVALLDRSRDLRVVLHLTRGLTWTSGLAGLRDSLAMARGLLERFWEPLHPQLVIDGEPDPVMRGNALAAFGERDGLVRDVRSALFIKCALGSFTVRDVERILDPKAPGDRPVTADQLRAMVRDAIVADAGALAEATQCGESLAGIRAIAMANLDAAQAPDLSALQHLLKVLDDLTGPIRKELSAAGAASAAPGDAPVAPSAAPVAVGVGEIRSRDDAVKALERVCEYLGRSEPTNPAPLIIRRAQRLMTMPFMDIIKDLAPDAASQVEKITGKP